MAGRKEITEQTEYARLKRQYSRLPNNKKAVAEGLFVEAARLRVLLDKLSEDIIENGPCEMFTQSPDAPPYERERPASRLYLTANKNYQAIIKQLTDMIPIDAPGTKGSKLGKLQKAFEGPDNETPGEEVPAK